MDYCKNNQFLIIRKILKKCKCITVYLGCYKIGIMMFKSNSILKDKFKIKLQQFSKYCTILKEKLARYI